MQGKPILRKISLVVCMLALVALALYAPGRRAEAAGAFVCAYYSDATYTTVVGARGTGCCGDPISWGITTPYKKCQILLCPDVVCSNAASSLQHVDNPGQTPMDDGH